MNSKDFVEKIKLYVRDPAIEETIATLTKPPGISPSKSLLELSDWYNSLEEAERIKVLRVATLLLDAGLFSFFCVLDGVRTIEDAEHRGELKLIYSGEDVEVLLNDGTHTYLHDLYNDESN